MTKYEKNVLALIIVFFILYFYGIFVSIYDRTHTEAKLIENLEMQVNELASLSSIQDIAKSYGLSYNNDNIIVIK